MSDAGWTALTQMVTALCTLLAALFARQAVNVGRENAQRIDENTERIESHEQASAGRGRLLQAEVRAVPLRPPSQSFHPGGEGNVPPSQQG